MGFEIHLVFLSSEMHTEERVTSAQIMGTNRKTFGLRLFVNLIQREEIPHMVYSKKRQLIT